MAERVVWTGPWILTPVYRLYDWWISRWIRHDCAKHPVTCRLPWSLGLWWIDREAWTEWVED